MSGATEPRPGREAPHWLGRRELLLLVAALVTPFGCTLPGPRSQANPPDGVTVDLSRLQSTLDDLWGSRVQATPASTGAPIFWNAAYSPYLPSEWPPSKSTVWTRYAYAYGRDPNLSDGVRTAYPWAKIERRAGSDSAVIIVLSNAVAELGVQGVRPADPASLRALGRDAEVTAFCLQLTGLPEKSAPGTTEMLEYYRVWRANHGVIAKTLLPNHAAFWDWIG